MTMITIMLGADVADVDSHAGVCDEEDGHHIIPLRFKSLYGARLSQTFVS
jgi:hypothetical protein